MRLPSLETLTSVSASGSGIFDNMIFKRLFELLVDVDELISGIVGKIGGLAQKVVGCSLVGLA